MNDSEFSKKRKKLPMVTCPNCKMRVLPKADGTCPSCHKSNVSRGHPGTVTVVFHEKDKPDEVLHFPWWVFLLLGAFPFFFTIRTSGDPDPIFEMLPALFIVIGFLLVILVMLSGGADQSLPGLVRIPLSSTLLVSSVIALAINFDRADKFATMQSTQTVAALADDPYVDPKGFFIVTPPKGWNIQEYPSDPRGKVEFGKTEGDQLVEIRVLVQVTQVTDFQEFVGKLKANAENLGFQPEWQEMMFSNLPAIKSTMTVQDGGMTRKIMNLRFLDGNIYHDIQFASSPTLFDKYQDLVSKVVSTYEIVK